MVALNSDSLAAVLALVGLVIVVAALLSGFIERSNAPQVAIFLGLGAVLGPAGLGVLHITLHSPILRVVSTLSLALVLFTDAVSINIPEVRRQTGLTLRVLGPGTLLSAVLIGLAAYGLLHLSIAASVILGAALASTDPVLLRGLLRRGDIPSTARQALRLESGLNDVVLLPIVLVAMQFLSPGPGLNAAAWVKMGLNLFLLGPVAGIAVGLLGVATLDLVRRRVGIRRDYESLYSLGVAFAAFAAAETVHGSGFLAVFAAGLTIAFLDVELCDCFLEYGETTAELALLFTFVLLGSSLIWSGFAILTVAIVLFAILTLLVRPIAFLVALAGTHLGKKAHTLISWFGPRGLSTLLLILLPVFAGVPGSEHLFSVCCLVVVLSVVLHGGSLMVLGNKKRTAPETPKQTEVEAETPSAPDGIVPPHLRILIPVVNEQKALDGNGASPSTNGIQSLDHPEAPPAPDEERITVAEMQRRKEAGDLVVVLDVRSERTFNDSDLLAADAVRIDPNRAVEDVKKRDIPKDAWIVAFCACPNDRTSLHVADDLRFAGWPHARALAGGWDAWQAAGLPTEAKAQVVSPVG